MVASDLKFGRTLAIVHQQSDSTRLLVNLATTKLGSVLNIQVYAAHSGVTLLRYKHCLRGDRQSSLLDVPFSFQVRHSLLARKGKWASSHIWRPWTQSFSKELISVVLFLDTRDEVYRWNRCVGLLPFEMVGWRLGHNFLLCSRVLSRRSLAE